jgi:hypothetical protein
MTFYACFSQLRSRLHIVQALGGGGAVFGVFNQLLVIVDSGTLQSKDEISECLEFEHAINIDERRVFRAVKLIGVSAFGNIGSNP